MIADLAGKVAAVTGAGSGIGRALCERFAAEGMRVVAADVEVAALEETAGQLRKAGAEVLAVPTDVRDAAAVDDLAREATEEMGPVSLVCANAGVFVGGVLWDRPPQDWEWVLGVNVLGVAHTVRAFVPAMVAAGDPGHVVVTASLAGIATGPMAGVYHASKFAAVALAESLHHDLTSAGVPVGVSVLCPDLVATEIGRSGRNRPSALDDGAAHPDAELVDQFLYEQTTTKGDSPDDVAIRVVDAVRSGRFYVDTGGRFDAAVDARAAFMHERSVPVPQQFD